MTELAQRLYGEEQEPEYNAIDTLIRRLRLKLDPTDILLPIATLRGRGYRLAVNGAKVSGLRILSEARSMMGDDAPPRLRDAPQPLGCLKLNRP